METDSAPSSVVAESDDNEEVTPIKTDESVVSSNATDVMYNPKKPRWWKGVAGSITKGQKKAMRSILAEHRLPSVSYGEFIELGRIYRSNLDIWFEIGFGQGENLLALAHRKRNEDVAFIGAEIHQAAVGTACRRMLEGKEVGRFWTDYTVFPENDRPSPSDVPNQSDDEEKHDNPYQKLLLHPGDGVKLLPYIPSSSLSAVLITFPDPFPRKHERQWRVVQKHSVREIHRVLKDNGRFFLATDHEGFNEWAHLVVDAVNEELLSFRELNPCPNRMEWLPVVSKYEQKGRGEGRITNLNCWEKV